MSERLERLKSEVEAWARRRTSRSPSRARTDVLEKLGEGRAPWSWGWTALGSSVITAVVVAVITLGPRLSPETVSNLKDELAERPAASQLMLELSSGTRLYLTLSGKTQVGLVKADKQGEEDQS